MPDDAVNSAVIASELRALKEQQEKDTNRLFEALDSMRRDFTEWRSGMVARGEWLQRNERVDATFQSQGREIGELRLTHAGDVSTLRREIADEVKDLRNEAAQRRAPWWAVASVIVGVVGVALAVIQGLG